MSVSLKQLAEMADIAESLANELRELIALRKIIDNRSIEHLKAGPPRGVARPLKNRISNTTARRVPYAKTRTTRSLASI